MDIRRRSEFNHVHKRRSLIVPRYVAKIIFTYILGYKVDVGHMEAVNLISSSKYSEKQIVRASRVIALPDSAFVRDIWQLPY
jgi:hypothetical protein